MVFLFFLCITVLVAGAVYAFSIGNVSFTLVLIGLAFLLFMMTVAYYKRRRKKRKDCDIVDAFNGIDCDVLDCDLLECDCLDCNIN